MLEAFVDFFNDYPFVDYMLRVFLALVLGFCIGFERKSRSKEAGIRTHAIVAVGAALYTIVSKYGFEGDHDSSRVAAQVVAGIGFLGAGMILHQRNVIHGLTTAAGIWATAGIGMAAAAGLWEVAVCATLLIIGVQIVLHSNFKLFRQKRYFSYRVAFYETDDAKSNLYGFFGVDKFSRLRAEKRDGKTFSTATIKTDKEISDDAVTKILEQFPFVVSCESIADEID